MFDDLSIHFAEAEIGKWGWGKGGGEEGLNSLGGSNSAFFIFQLCQLLK